MGIDKKVPFPFTQPPQSYWMASTPQAEHPNYPSLQEDIKVDIAIVGGGMVGILTAYMLGKEGGSIAILEADRILQGTTGHTTAKITSQHGLIYQQIKGQISQEVAKQYAEANESAIRLFEAIANEHRIDCDFTPQSAYIYTQQDQYVSKLQQEAEVASDLGIQATYLEEIPLPFAVKAAVRFDQQAQYHPRKFLLALAQKITDQGVQIYEQSRVVDMEEDGPFTLTTRQGKKVTADRVIIASHYPFYNKHGLYFTRIYPERSYILAIKAADPFPGGMYINAEEPARSLRSQPSPQGELILIGGEHHKTGQSPDTLGHYQALATFAQETFTLQDIPYRWSTQDCMTLDGLPYVGRFASDTTNLYLATGFGKWGMSNSMVSAQLFRDLILKGESPWQEAYDPSRKTILASAKNFIIENLNVAKELIEGKSTILPENVELDPGEGKVIGIRGERTGAYKDPEGTLHLVNTTCTHMGCELNWNGAETSWDCPCHGSRFTYEGGIVEGPAVQPLDRNHDVNTLEKLIKDEY